MRSRVLNLTTDKTVLAAGGTMAVLLGFVSASLLSTAGERSVGGAVAALAIAMTAMSVAMPRRVHALDSRVMGLEGTLDAVPQLISVTDLDMNWVFVNRATEGLKGSLIFVSLLPMIVTPVVS